MPTSLPTIPASDVVPFTDLVPMVRFPPGTWFVIGWTVLGLMVGLLANISVDLASMDALQLTAMY